MPSGPQMPTSVTIKHLLKDISALSNTLSDAVPKGSKDDKIWSVLNTKEGDIPHETFNHRFNALFGEDCCDFAARLLHVRQPNLAIALFISYLPQITSAT